MQPLLSLLLLALSGSTAASLNDTLTCIFDPFYHLRPLRPQQCSLSIESPLDLPPQSEFLSFEDWKARQLAVAELEAVRQAELNSTASSESSHLSAQDGLNDLTLAESAPGTPPSEAAVDASPDVHVRVPLRDRFNYASLDCSARIHSSHKSSKSAYHILSPKKDKYMLSPCASSDNFVVVELCDDIQVDTVQLANFEFFSGVFKDIKVSAAQTYSSDPQEWVDFGTHRAKNVRSVQSFHPIHQDFKFYRYIRVDFLSHYGAEYYCPVSLLRVYGLTQMEEYKWEEWQTAWKAERARAIAAESEKNGAKEQEKVVSSESMSSSADKPQSSEENAPDGDSSSVVLASSTVSSPTTSTSASTSVQTEPESSQSSTISVQSSTTSNSLSSTTSTSSSETTSPASSSFLDTAADIQPSTSSTIDSQATSVETLTLSSSPPPADSGRFPVTTISTNSSYAAPTLDFSSETLSSASVSSSSKSRPSPSAGINAGESIYRTIMNRLGILESNSTLGVRYVEEQMRTVRETLKRVEDDMKRLEGMSKAQQQIFQRTLTALEKQKHEMEAERSILLIKVHSLTDEVILEKRLGVAQLVLLLIVLVFLAFTRGATAPTPPAIISHSTPPRNTVPATPKPTWRPSRSEDLDASNWRAKARSPSSDVSAAEGGVSTARTKQRSRERSRPSVDTNSPSLHRSELNTNVNPSTSTFPPIPRLPFQAHKGQFSEGTDLIKRSHSQSAAVRKDGHVHGNSPAPKRSGKLAHLHEVGMRRRKLSLKGLGESSERAKEGNRDSEEVEVVRDEGAEREDNSTAPGRTVENSPSRPPPVASDSTVGSDAWEDTSDAEEFEAFSGPSSPVRGVLKSSRTPKGSWPVMLPDAPHGVGLGVLV